MGRGWVVMGFPPPGGGYGEAMGGYGAGMSGYGAGMGGYGAGMSGYGVPPPPAAVMGRSIVAVSVWVGGNTLGGAPRLPHRGWGVRGVPGGRWGTIGRYGVLMGHHGAP